LGISQNNFPFDPADIPFRRSGASVRACGGEEILVPAAVRQ
jgi:hypothetical protein